MPVELTVVGSINLDLVARVERLPRPGETLAAYPPVVEVRSTKQHSECPMHALILPQPEAAVTVPAHVLKPMEKTLPKRSRASWPTFHSPFSLISVARASPRWELCAHTTALGRRRSK